MSTFLVDIYKMFQRKSFTSKTQNKVAIIQVIRRIRSFTIPKKTASPLCEIQSSRAASATISIQVVISMICGGIGMGAQMALADAGIKLYAGVQGSADDAAKALAEGTLEYDPDAHCDHHMEYKN